MVRTFIGRLEKLIVGSDAKLAGLKVIGGVSVGLTLVPHAAAHVIPDEGAGTQVNAAIVSTWRSASVVDGSESWHIPGTLMGGGAHPVNSGFNIDEVSLKAARRLDANTFVKLGLGIHQGGAHGGSREGSHDGGAHQSVALEHASLGFVCCESKGPWVAEVGVLSAAFTPELMGHRSTESFSDPSLIADVFFGRHFHDQGVRVWLHETAGWSVGAEIWQGNAFPATSRNDDNKGGASDIFARYQFDHDKLNIMIGTWLYTANAKSRAIHHQAESGHHHASEGSHGDSNSHSSDMNYTGDVVLYGIDTSLTYKWNAATSFGVKLSWAKLMMDGVVQQSGHHTVDFETDQYAVWMQPYMNWQQHTWAVRVEELVVDNHFSGASAGHMGHGAGVSNESEYTPRRTSFAWIYQWRPQTAFRAEWIQDETVEDAQNRFTLGVIWHGSLLSNSHLHAGH